MRQNLEFTRHIDAQRVVRRLQTRLRQALGDMLGEFAAPRAAGDLSLSATPPLPLFAPRSAGLDRHGRVLRFTFQNRTIPMGASPKWRAPGPGPEDQLWRMSLHCMEYLEPLNDVAFAAFVEDWIENNPPDAAARHDSWSVYALSIRVVVWMQQIGRRKRLPPPFIAQVAESLSQQLRFLERNLETDIGGNHLIKNIKALIWASAFFSGADAERWRAIGLKHLAEQLEVQILPDGVHYERSPSYHCQVFADLLECREALGGDLLGGTLDIALERIASATIAMTHPDGEVALFNDAGLAMAYSPAECLAAYERLLGPPPEPRRFFALKSAGYFGMRDNGNYFIADCGPIAPDALVAHAHGDILSFEWSVAGRRIVVDQGVYEYNAGARRQKARSAGSHNTLSIEGAEQAEFFGAFRCGRRPKVDVLRCDATVDGFALEGAHDAYARLPGKPQYARRFEVSQESVSILDLLAGSTEKPASIGFLLHPKCKATLVEGHVFISRDGVRVRLDCSAPLKIEDAVWWPDMGVEIPTHRIRAAISAGDDRTVRSRLSVVA